MNVILVTVKLPGLVRPFLATYDRVSQVALDGTDCCMLTCSYKSKHVTHTFCFCADFTRLFLEELVGVFYDFILNWASRFPPVLIKLH